MCNDYQIGFGHVYITLNISSGWPIASTVDFINEHSTSTSNSTKNHKKSL